MSVQLAGKIIESNFSNKLETQLKESRYEMQVRTQSILMSLNSQAIAAKKDVRHHLQQIVKVQSALSSSKKQ